MPVPSKLSIFIDESGDTNLPNGKSGRSRFYILNAVIVNSEEIETVRAQADAIRVKHKLSEIHSADMRTDKRRITVLSDAVELNIKSYTFAVDKEEIDKSSGLGFKDSFYKYINRKFYERLVQNWGDVEICVDEYGTESFMKRFREYLAREDKMNLFSPRFRQCSSNDEVLLQIADIIGGSIGRCIDPSKRADNRSRYIELLSKVSIGITCWPVRLAPQVRQNSLNSASGQHDAAIQEYCFQYARKYLEFNHEADENGLAKAAVIEYLLYVAEWIDETRWIQTDELIHQLLKLGYDVNPEKLRRSIIGPLRDDDLIIASSSRGYKLPVCLADVKHFVLHTNSIVPPMLSRLSRARDALKARTLGALDILADEELAYLRKVLEAGAPLQATSDPEHAQGERRPPERPGENGNRPLP